MKVTAAIANDIMVTQSVESSERHVLSECIIASVNTPWIHPRAIKDGQPAVYLRAPRLERYWRTRRMR